jgi:hypothetical protein
MTETKRERLDALTTEHRQAVTKLEELKRARAQARIDGDSFSGDAEIGTLQITIEGLSEAVGLAQAQVDREEDRALALWKADRARKVGEAISTHADAYLASVVKAAEAIDTLVSELGKVNSAAISIVALGREIPGLNDVPPFNSSTIMMRLSERVGRAFSRIHGLVAPGNYGRLAWAPEQAREENWGTEERLQIRAVIEELMQRLEQEISKQQALADAE